MPCLKCRQVAESTGCRKPTESIQNPLQQKTAEGLSPESRASVPGCPLGSSDSKRAELIADTIVYNVQQTAQKLSGAVQKRGFKCSKLDDKFC